MDLHAWITQRVDRIDATARAVEDRSAPFDGQWMADGNSALRTFNGHVLFYRRDSAPLKPGLADHVAQHDPAAVLRRCEADRRILARHRLDPAQDAFPVACEGCGFDDWGLPNIENLNDCPELLDLGHAHGLTAEILAGLDRPAPPEPKPINPSRYANGGILAHGSIITTSDVPEALRGPRWKP